MLSVAPTRQGLVAAIKVFMDIHEQIRERVKAVPYLWRKITTGGTEGRCKIYSTIINRRICDLPGLSTLQVYNKKQFEDHSWIIAHHPDTGYFMICPTAGQYLSNAREEFNDAFIGKMADLVPLAKRFGITEPQYCWTPALTNQDSVITKPKRLTAEQESLWACYPDGHVDFLVRNGLENDLWVAAAFKKTGHDWISALRTYQYWPIEGPVPEWVEHIEAALGESPGSAASTMSHRLRAASSRLSRFACK